MLASQDKPHGTLQEQPSSSGVEPNMSTNVVQLKMVRGRLVATEKAHDRSEEEEVAKICVRLVYCMAGWDDEGMARGRSPTGCQISAAPSRHSLRTEPRSFAPLVVQAPSEPPGFVPADWGPAEGGLVASPLYGPTQDLRAFLNNDR